MIIRGVRLRDQRDPGLAWSSLIASFYVIAIPPSSPETTVDRFCLVFTGVTSVTAEKINLRLFCKTLSSRLSSYPLCSTVTRSAC